jgi:hypothetical protein
VEHQVARSKAGFDADERRPVRGDGARGRVVSIDVDAIVAEIAREEMAIVGREIDRMRMRALLSLRVGPLAGVLIARRRTQTAVGADLEPDGASARVVRHGHGAARSRDG